VQIPNQVERRKFECFCAFRFVPKEVLAHRSGDFPRSAGCDYSAAQPITVFADYAAARFVL
jgi:hypothetical protein